jgi:hypothetical protein
MIHIASHTDKFFFDSNSSLTDLAHPLTLEIEHKLITKVD